jgi:hypothetical protein
MASSLPTNGISSSGFANLMSNNNNNNNDGSSSNNSSSQVYYLAPNVQRTADQLTEEEQLATGVHPGLVRLSVGLESIDDILADLDAGFAAAK